jgi:hypothetical protein
VRLRRSTTLVALSIAAAAVLSLISPGGANAAPGDSSPLLIVSDFNGKCLDAEAFAGWNGTKVQLWDCNGQPQQQWILRPFDGYYQIVNNKWPSKCLNADNSAGQYPAGARVQLWDCDWTANMAWRTAFTDFAHIHFLLFTFARDDMVLDSDVSQGDVNGMKAQMWWEFNPIHANQVWHFG